MYVNCKEEENKEMEISKAEMKLIAEIRRMRSVAF